MNAQVPAAVAENALSRSLASSSLTRIHRGKVRDTYELPGHPDKLLVVATDRISIFDFVLGRTVPRKGEVLTALTVFWLTQVFGDVEHHLVTFGVGIDLYLPEALRGNAVLQRRAVIVDKLQMLPVECIARGYLTGTGLAAYKKDGKVCGIELPPDLYDGSQLPQQIFTPTTKAKIGHDEHISADSVDMDFGVCVGRKTRSLYARAQSYAISRGIIIADTKLEFGERNGRLVLADEVLTPDSSRFWDGIDYVQAQAKGKSPTGFDKEPVRQAGKVANIQGSEVDISRLDPTYPQDIDLVASWNIPSQVLLDASERYFTITERLIGYDLATVQQRLLGIN